MLRLIIIVLYLVIYLLVSLPIQLVLFIMSKSQLKKAKEISLSFVQWGFKCILFLTGAKIDIRGEENVPTDTPVLYVGNHRSYFDIVITYSRVPRLTGYIAKKEMTKVPILSRWMKYLDCLFLDRDDIRQGLQIILTAIDQVKNGTSMTIYPEGTRNRTDQDLIEFHKGSFKIAQKAGCPIIPVVVNNTDDIFEAHPWAIRPAHVVVEYCKPIYLNELSKEELKNIDDYVRTIILEKYQANKSLI
ncbi:MAG: 1-acyl-sn-glycerol-3-phosphate acyltransferase [Butyrivibrio sp.]|nr:1-acyl-sn-glycerol-3-phosphate acyltransferase [Butyrivibrio sp.]MCR4833895.1 1-acyl-sn-glycerol-3-phosphate acyltransferase [Butyrivibrio sp.]